MSLARIASLMLVAILAQPAGAGLTEELATWPDGPAGFLLTKDEHKAWDAVANDEEARHFIALFWARRDPNLRTIENEAFNEFVARVRYADEHFATADRRGALTDRGRLLIVLGPPYRVERRGPTHTMETIDSNSAGSDEVWAQAELWEYLPRELPVPTRGSSVIFVLYEQRAGSESFVLDRSHPATARGLRILRKASLHHLLHPDLAHLPRIPGGSDRTPEAAP